MNGFAKTTSIDELIMRELVGPRGTYRVDPSWPSFPANGPDGEAVAVACDSHDRVFVFLRGPRPVQVFEPTGIPIADWGSDVFTRPHGITVDRHDLVYCTDDLDHTVRIFSRSGRWRRTLGESGVSSDTGASSLDYRTILHAGPPFHYPTNVAVAKNGEIFVTDGYGNSRVHRFSPEGDWLASWGQPGSGPGQFHVPHGIAIDSHGRLFVADRENRRIQIFTQSGEHLGEWNAARPNQVAFDGDGNVYVAELGYRAGRWPGTGEAEPGETGGRVSIFDPEGVVLARWGGGDDPCVPGDFFAPHGICVDSQGAVYVAEVAWTAGARIGRVPGHCHTLQKFVPVR